MIQFLIKILLTSILVAAISEIGKRSSLMAGVYASLPIITLFSIVWLYLETSNAQKAASFSFNVLMAIIPSCVFLALFPVLIRLGFNFWISLLASVVTTAFVYWLYLAIIKHFGINF